MPNINLPTIDFNIDEHTSKQTMEQILDTLLKYRKELNYLLMNLDLDNMPAIGGIIGDIDGDFSSIMQTIDAIDLRVGNAEGDLASLTLTAQGLQTQVSDNAGNISTLTQTAQGIQTQVSNNAGDISTLTQTAQGLQTQVSDNAGNISTLTQTAQGIQSQVSSHDTLLGTHTSQISQLGNEVSSIVSFTDVDGNDIASLINQTATTITIAASKIDLTGVTTIYDADPLYAGFKVQANGRGLNFIDHLGGSYASISYDGFGGAMIYSQAVLQVGSPTSTVSFRGGISFADASNINWGSYEPIAKFA